MLSSLRSGRSLFGEAVGLGETTGLGEAVGLGETVGLGEAVGEGDGLTNCGNFRRAVREFAV